MLDKAIALAAHKFVGKFDKGGAPYILHCLHVMAAVAPDRNLMTAAVLHDIVEDTDTTLDDLRSIGFSERTINTVAVLTHDKDEPYEKYIKRIVVFDDARKIKLADLEHNSLITRLKGFTKKDFDRLEKYVWAYEYLKMV